MSSSKRKGDDDNRGSAPKRASGSSGRGGLASIFGSRTDPLPPLRQNPLSFPPKLEGTVKLTTWNVNGLKSAGSKEKGYAFRKYIEAEQADVVILTEVKYPEASTADELDWLRRHYKHRYWSAPGVKGQVAILSKIEPISAARYGFPDWAESDRSEAVSRNITLEFENCYLIGSYVQNSGQNKQFMERKLAFNRDLQRYVNELQKTKPVVWSGDFNAIADKKDVENPGVVWDKKPGCLPEEREANLDLLKSTDLVDVWRLIHPNAREYSHTSVFAFGWRLDGFIVSRSIVHRIKWTEIRHSVHEHFASSSDHWPVACVLEGGL